jgi:hypothetical protein
MAPLASARRAMAAEPEASTTNTVVTPRWRFSRQTCRSSGRRAMAVCERVRVL